MDDELYRVALNQLSSIVVVDNKGIISDVNENFCRSAQYPAFELIGRPLSIIQASYHAEQFFANLLATIVAGQVWRGEIKNKSQDGSFFWLEASICALKDKDDQLTGFFCSGLDITAKKEAEIELRRQVQSANYIIEHSTDGFASVNANWQITYFNKNLEVAIGLNQEQNIGRNFLDIFIAETQAYEERDKLRQAIADQRPARFDVYYPNCKSWFEISVYPAGEELALTFRNITEQKTIAERIRRSEQELRAILQSTVDAFFFIGLDKRIISFNERARKSIRHLYDQELQVGDDIRQYCFEGDIRTFTACFEEALRGEPVQIERKTQVKGKPAWYWMTYFPVFNDDHQIIGVVLNSSNIDSLKFLEAETLRVNERFRLAAKAANDAIYDWNMERDIIQWYEAFYEMFGYETREVKSSLNWWADCIHPAEKETVVNSLNQAILNKQTHWHAEYRFRCRDGSYKFIYDRGYLVYSETGAPSRMIGALQDIQQIKEHERKITQQNEQLREIAFSQSHEVRRPVANILGLLRCLNKEDFGPENQKVLHFLEQTTVELDELIRKIVDKAYHT